MHFELTKYNMEVVKKVLENPQGKTIFINGTALSGVKSIEFETGLIYDGDPDPTINYDGGKRETIDLTFKFETGEAVHKFCPDEKVCEIVFEQDDLWIINFTDLKEYSERQIEFWNDKIKDYEEFMSR